MSMVSVHSFKSIARGLDMFRLAVLIEEVALMVPILSL